MQHRFGKHFVAGVAAIGLCLAALDRAIAGPAGAGEEASEKLSETAGQKADKLPVPQTSQPSGDYPVAAGGKEDRQPLPPQTTKTKSLDGPADDRLTPDPPNPDRLLPEQP